jgi:hypothetical protein
MELVIAGILAATNLLELTNNVLRGVDEWRRCCAGQGRVGKDVVILEDSEHGSKTGGSLGAVEGDRVVTVNDMPILQISWFCDCKNTAGIGKCHRVARVGFKARCSSFCEKRLVLGIDGGLDIVKYGRGRSGIAEDCKNRHRS